MLRRLAAAALALLALLPTTWAVAPSGCGVSEPCCCADGASDGGAAWLPPDSCCCEVTTPRDAPASPQTPRDLARGLESPPPPAALSAPCIATARGDGILGPRSCPDPRPPPGALYLRHHAFLC